jgi:hypothetical protein
VRDTNEQRMSKSCGGRSLTRSFGSGWHAGKDSTTISGACESSRCDAPARRNAI